MIRVPRTLFTKLLLVITVFCLLMTTICIFLMRGWHGSYHSEADQILNREVARNIVAQNLYIDRASLDASNYQEGMANLAQRHPMEEAYLLGADGSVLAAPVQAADIARQSVDIEPVKKFLSGVARLPIYGDDPQRLFGEAVFSAANIEIQGFPARYLYVILHPSDSGAVLNTVRRDYVFNETIGVLLLSALLAIFATLAIMRVLVRNLGRLEAAMEGFRASGFAALPAALPRSEMRHGDEIERLTGLFWELAEKLQERMNDLQQSDEVRRDILANVSHDLRTPLATLLAHIETLVLKPDFPIEERAHYLQISLRQCQSLGALVEQLLEAARLDAGDVPFEPEVFHLGELLQDVAQKFELRAAQAGVQLQIDEYSALPLVRGDIKLIERALDNLIDNAMNYTSSGGHVALRAESVDGSIRITVVDSGVGLALQEQHRVTERFYRADKSRQQGGGHAGLGLAIVNAIAGLHGSQLRFSSEPGKGTTVSFDLPID